MKLLFRNQRVDASYEVVKSRWFQPTYIKSHCSSKVGKIPSYSIQKEHVWRHHLDHPRRDSSCFQKSTETICTMMVINQATQLFWGLYAHHSSLKYANISNNMHIIHRVYTCSVLCHHWGLMGFLLCLLWFIEWRSKSHKPTLPNEGRPILTSKFVKNKSSWSSSPSFNGGIRLFAGKIFPPPTPTPPFHGPNTTNHKNISVFCCSLELWNLTALHIFSRYLFKIRWQFVVLVHCRWKFEHSLGLRTSSHWKSHWEIVMSLDISDMRSSQRVFPASWRHCSGSGYMGVS